MTLERFFSIGADTMTRFEIAALTIAVLRTNNATAISWTYIIGLYVFGALASLVLSGAASMCESASAVSEE